MKKTKNENNFMGDIPSYFTFIGILMSALSIGAIIFACKILF